MVAVGALRSAFGAPIGVGGGLWASAGGVRRAELTTFAWGARAGLGHRAGAWEADLEGAAAFGFVAPFGAFARLGAGGGALSGPAGRVGYVTCPMAELGYQTIRMGGWFFDAGFRAGSLLAGGVDPAGAPPAPLPLAPAAGGFLRFLAPAPGLTLETQVLHWAAGARGPVGRAKAVACWLRDVWALCADAGYERLGRDPGSPGAVATTVVGGLSLGVGVLR